MWASRLTLAFLASTIYGVQAASNPRADAVTSNASDVTEGFAAFDYPAAGKSLETWYRITGSFETSSSSAVPLITLHGGPGGGYFATNPFTQLWADHGIPVIQYDQIGCGNSTHLTELADAGASFWNDGLFVAELESLIANLGLEEYDVLGYSWGGMLAARFGSTRPSGLRRLILMSAPASSELWAESMAQLRATLPQDVQDALDEGEKNGTTDSDAYQAASDEFSANFLCRISPTPADVTATTATVVEDPTVYGIMWGTSEFEATGTLQNWTVVDVVSNITVPTLVTNGEYDEAGDVAIQPHLDNIPDVQYTKYANASHTAQYETPDVVLERVAKFLTS